MRGDWRAVVRDGYDAVSEVYRRDDDAPVAYREWAEELIESLPTRNGRVLDLGCGCGVPMARDLAASGHVVTGVDISSVQIRRARALVPAGTFSEADISRVAFPASSFDAVTCLYALIHLPNPEQHRVIQNIGTWLRPGGLLLATVGAQAATGSDPDWLGTGTTMWWNHPDPAITRRWVRDAGLSIVSERFVPEGSTGHQLLLAARDEPSAAPRPTRSSAR